MALENAVSPLFDGLVWTKFGTDINGHHWQNAADFYEGLPADQSFPFIL